MRFHLAQGFAGYLVYVTPRFLRVLARSQLVLRMALEGKIRCVYDLAIANLCPHNGMTCMHVYCAWRPRGASHLSHWSEWQLLGVVVACAFACYNMRACM